MRKRFDIKTKLVLYIGSIFVISFVIFIGYVFYQMSRMAKNDAEMISVEMAFRYANIVEKDLDFAMNKAKGLAHTFISYKRSASTIQRDLLVDILRSCLENNDELFGVWTVWEPNALDARDNDYVNAPGHDATGRFIPYWNRAGGFHLEPCVDYDAPGLSGEYYRRPKATLKDVLMEPVSYKIGGEDITVVSMVSPIIVADRFMGVVGVDYSMKKFVELVANVKPYRSGYGAIIAHNGYIVAHPIKDRIGKTIDEAKYSKNNSTNEDHQAALMVNTETSPITREIVYAIYAPIQITGVDTIWQLKVCTPIDEVQAGARHVRNMASIMSVFAVVLLILMVSVISNKLIFKVENTVNRLKEYAEVSLASASEMSSVGQAISQGASEQAASIAETAASLELLAHLSKVNKEHIENIRNMIHTEVGTSYTTIDGYLKEMIETISISTDKSQKTFEIVGTIEEIAFYTNLLALNAAIESAKVGDVGSGFAVVSKEVRALAGRSAEAAQKASSLILESNQKHQAVSEMNTLVFEAFQSNRTYFNRVNDLIEKMAQITSEQTKGIEQINAAIVHIEKVIQQNAASSQEMASSTQQMHSQVQLTEERIKELHGIIGGVKPSK